LEQEITTKNNDNIAIFIAGAFALGLLTTAMYFMTQRIEAVKTTPEPVAETLEQLSEDAGIDFSNLVAVLVEEAEQGAAVADIVAPELQPDTEQ
jgi:hypothetical protein